MSYVRVFVFRTPEHVAISLLDAGGEAVGEEGHHADQQSKEAEWHVSDEVFPEVV